MDDLYVKEEYRGKGIGSELIKNMSNFGRENNCQKLRWQVSNWNEKAIAFYKQLGATIDENERNCNLILK